MKKQENNKPTRTDYLSTKTSFTSKTIDFSKINKDKIEEYIELMQEHQMNCVKARNFIEAELAKQRVIQLRKIQEKKQFHDATKRQGKETEELKNTKLKELKAFNTSFDVKYSEEMSKLEDMLVELRNKQDQEFQEYIENVENNYPTEPKPSNDLIDLQKQLEYYIKTEDYPNAHLAQVEIEELTKKEKENFELLKERKIEKDISSMRLKQNNEMKAMELKIENHKKALLREKQQKLLEIELKYKNKSKELERKQKAERDAYQRILSSGTGSRPNTTRRYSRSMPKEYS